MYLKGLDAKWEGMPGESAYIADLAIAQEPHREQQFFERVTEGAKQEQSTKPGK